MIHFKNSVIYVLDNFMNFMADEYIDFSGNKVQGENNLNSLLDDKLKIDCFSLGTIKSMSKSFLWATISEGESRGSNSYIGDSAGFADDISLKATVYKELKAGESFLAYTMIPLALNQVSRYWISKLNDEGERIALSPVIIGLFISLAGSYNSGLFCLVLVGCVGTLMGLILTIKKY